MPVRSLISLTHLIWSAETASSRFFQKIGFPPKLLSIIESFHTDTMGTVEFNCSSPEPFEIRGGFKQGCVLAPTLFGMFFVLLLKHALDTRTEGGGTPVIDGLLLIGM